MASILVYESSVEYESIKEQWSEHSPSSIVARVRFPDSASSVVWVCRFSFLVWEVFPSPKKTLHLIWFDFNLHCPQLVAHLNKVPFGNFPSALIIVRNGRSNRPITPNVTLQFYQTGSWFWPKWRWFGRIANLVIIISSYLKTGGLSLPNRSAI